MWHKYIPSGYSAVCITCGRTKAECQPSASVSGWGVIVAFHAQVEFWRTGWHRAVMKRTGRPSTQSKMDYLDRRWGLANARMRQVMQRADNYRKEHPNS
jgi:hypothetical protein